MSAEADVRCMQTVTPKRRVPALRMPTTHAAAAANASAHGRTIAAEAQR